MEIITNNKPRDLLYWEDLTANQKLDFDYLEDPDLASFFKYRDQVYDLGEFLRIDHNDALSGLGWHGISSQGYFNGILVKLNDRDPDRIIVGSYYS